MLPIVLASASPRRRELLEQIGLDFEVFPTDVDETVQWEEPGRAVQELACRKARAAAQASVTRSVSSPQPGDLFFYSNGSRINHVAMYIGNGLVIHASNPSDGIKISNAYYRHPVKIGRVMN